MKKINNRGFTLVELLAVILIMGILMLIAVPSISRVVENSRKDIFVDIVKSYTNSVRQLWASDVITCGNNNTSASGMDDGDYYILIDTADESRLSLLDQGGKSSWGNRDVKGYVRVNVSTVNDRKVTKFYVSLTDGMHGIYDNLANEKEADKLVRGDMLMNLGESSQAEILKKIQEEPFINGKFTTCSEDGGNWTVGVSDEAIIDVEGNIDSIGTIVKIGSEQFRVISSTVDSVTMLSEYNLYVGEEFNGTERLPYGNNATGRQDSSMRGWVSSDYPFKEISIFSNTSNVYAGSTVEEYVDNYKEYLVVLGVNILDARLITKEELENLGCFALTNSCISAPTWLFNTTFWSGTPFLSYGVWVVTSNGEFYDGHYSNNDSRGVRPVITISKSEL